MGTGRLETIADGVLAIAATLLILSVDTAVLAIALFYVLESSVFDKAEA